MTRPRGFSEPPPLVETVPALRTSAGVPVAVPVTITNTADEPRAFLVTAVGVDTTWLPFPSQSVAVPAGESVSAEMTLRPVDGTLPARYPLAVAVQALDPMTGLPRSATAIQSIDLVVDAPGQVSVALEPSDSTAIYSRKFFVVLQNTGTNPETVHLDARSPYSTAIDLPRRPVQIPPGGTVRVPGRLTVSRPGVFRRKVRHAYSVTARTNGAPRFAEGSLTSRSLIGPTGAKVVAALVIVALWVALALIFVPKLADKIRKPSTQAAGTQTLVVKPPHAGKGGAGTGTGGKNSGGSGGGNSPNGSGTGTGGGTGGGGGANGAGSTGKPAVIALNGTVTGSAPSGVLVSLSPSSFGTDTPGTTSSTSAQTVADSPIGKLVPQALSPDAVSTTAHRQSADRSVVTAKDGAWSFQDVKPVGYYTLQFTKPGYQTQRFIIDATSATVAQPMKVELLPGTGSLHGVVRNAAGGTVGAATISITDGTNTLTTSTVSKGAKAGTWSIDGLSTPSSYLVSASKAGLGVASKLITLAASGTGSVDLSMFSGMATLSGYIHAFTGGHDSGVGAVQITATNGTLVRSATTVTTGSEKGHFTLPELPLGKWVVTITAAGYQVQSRHVDIVAGAALAPLNSSLSTATATVQGAVNGAVDKTHTRPLPGAGLTLANTTNTYKQTSLKGGRFSFADVAPGTYTLTAQYFGYTTSYQTVVAVPGKQGKAAVFELGVQHTSNNSVISGYVGNAASSSGSLGCERSTVTTPEFPDGVPTLGCRVYFALTDGDGNPVPTTLTDAHNSNRPSGAVSPDGPTSYILSRNPKDGDGLPPGQYRLTIGAAGYLPATISIDVPLNGAATAPQVDLFPANSIAGRVNTIGQINGDGLDTPDTGQNCVVAVPIGFDPSVFDQAKFSCDQSSVPTGGFGPADVTRLQQKCTALGRAEPGYGVIADNGKYTVNGLCDGQYTVYLVISNPAYDPDAAPTPKQSVARGVTLEYSPSLPRKPLLQVQVNSLDANTGVTSAVSTTPVTAACTTAPSGTTTTETVTTDSNGLATLWGLAPGDVSCTITVNGVDALTGTISTVDDQTYPATATVVSALPATFAKIVSTYGSLDDNPVIGDKVHVTGIVGYVGATAISDTRPSGTDPDVVTNAFGCVAVAATNDALTSAEIPAGCGTAADFSAANIVVMPLRSKHVTLDLDAGPATQGRAGAGATLVDAADGVGAPEIAVTPIPVSTLGTAVTTVPSGLSLTNAVVIVHDAAATAHGSGTITAGINNAGQLTWADSNLPSGNLAWPGTYALDIKVPGFTDSLNAQFACGYFGVTPSLHCTLTPATINALGELRGQVTAPSLTPPHTVFAPLSGATVIARQCPTSATCPSVSPTSSTACTSQPTDATASTGFDGKYDFVGPGGVRYLPTGTYVLIVCASGMITNVVSPVPVTGGYVAGEDQDVAMSLLGGVSGVIKASNNGLGLQGVTVHLFSCATSDCDSGTTSIDQLTSGSGGAYQFSGATGRYFLPAGRYRLTFDATALGYTADHRDFDIVSADAPGDDVTSVTLKALGALGGTVTQAGTSPLQPVPSATLTLLKCTSSTDIATCSQQITTTHPDGGGNYQFSGSSGKYFLSDGYYELKADAPGYSSSASAAPVHIVSGDNPGDVSLTLQGSLHGTITDNLTGNPGVSTATVKVEKCVSDTDTACPSVTGQPADAFTTVTDVSGQYSFTSLGNANLFRPGQWRMTLTAAGHQRKVVTISITSGDNTPSVDDQRMLAKDALGGTVTLDGDPAAPISNATLAVRLHCADPASCVNPVIATTTSNPDGTYQFSGSGGRYFLDDGTYDVTATAPAYATTLSPSVTTTSGDNTADISMSRLAALQGTITDNTTGNPGVAGATVTVKQCTDSATPCTATTDASKIRQTTTDSSGAFSFSALGTPYLFAPGKWQVTIAAPGHVTSDRTDVTLGNGINTVVAPDQLPLLVAYGSVTGTVFGAGATTQQLSGATVTATRCLDTDNPAVSCSGTSVTATTNTSGVYTFAGTGTPWALAPGTWRFTAAAFGYQSNSISKAVGSGVNPTVADPNGFDITDTVRSANQPIQVKIADNPARYTQHVSVTLVRNDAPATTIPTTQSGTTFTPAALLPGTYTITVVGDNSTVGQSIQLTNATLNIPLIGSQPGDADLTIFTVPASVYRTSLTGTVVGTNGQSSTANLGGIPIELYAAGSTSRATDLGDDPIYTATTLPSGLFSISGIPNGTYDVHINDVDRDTSSPAPAGLASPNTSYGATTVSSVSIAYGAGQNLGTVTLAPTTQTVRVTVTFDSQEDLGGGTGTLTPSDSATWTALTVTTPTGTGNSRLFTFNNVPRGCWAFTLPFSSGSVHVGTVSSTAGTSGCRVSVPASQTTLGTPVSVTYHFNEYVMQVQQLTVNPNSPADAASSPTFTLAVVNSGGNSVSSTTITATTTTTLYLAPDTYSVTLTRGAGVSADMWPTVTSGTNRWSKSVDLTSASSIGSTIVATEADLASLTVPTFTNSAGNSTDASNPMTLTLKCASSQGVPAGCGSTGLTSTDTGSSSVFTGLAPGNWTLKITGNPVGPGGTITVTHSVTLTSGSNSFTWP